MKPAFDSPRQAAGFAALLGLLFALPALTAGLGRPDRPAVYASLGWGSGAFPWIAHQIGGETNDADIVFMGSSRILVGVDPRHVQTELSRRLGRPAVVFTLGWSWSGNDLLYFAARDLLARRRVGTLVTYNQGGSGPHQLVHRWYQAGSDPRVTQGLPGKNQLQLYGAAILGSPRHLLDLLRPELGAKPSDWTREASASLPEELTRRQVVENLGAIRYPWDHGRDFQGFRPFRPETSARPEDVVIKRKGSPSAVRFAGAAEDPYSAHFARALAVLCREHGTRLVVLHLPNLRETADTGITERAIWPAAGGDQDIPVVGVPGARLFGGLTPADLHRLFYDDYHLNANGQDLFTPLITPALLDLHLASHVP